MKGKELCRTHNWHTHRIAGGWRHSIEHMRSHKCSMERTDLRPWLLWQTEGLSQGSVFSGRNMWINNYFKIEMGRGAIFIMSSLDCLWGHMRFLITNLDLYNQNLTHLHLLQFKTKTIPCLKMALPNYAPINSWSFCFSCFLSSFAAKPHEKVV